MFPSTKSRSRHPMVYIALYCASTISLLFFNKWLFTKNPEFRFVLTITWLQQFGVCALIFMLHPFLVLVIGNVGYSRILFKRVSSVGLIASVDYAFSNLALQALPMTIYEIVKSCAPAIVLTLSIAFGLMKANWRLCLVVAIIVSGAIIAVYRPPEQPKEGSSPAEQKEVTTIGLFFISMAAFFAASKSVAAQVTLQGDKSKLPKHSVSMYRKSVRALRRGSSMPTLPATPVLSEPSMMSNTPTNILSVTSPDAAAANQEDITGTAVVVHTSPDTNASPVADVGASPNPSLQKGLSSGDLQSYGAADTNTSVNLSGTFGTSINSSMCEVDKEAYDRYGPINPATVAFVCAVVTVITVLPVASFREYEGLKVWIETIPWETKVRNLTLVFMGSTLSVVANICSFFVMRETSALTYALVAVCQRCLTVITAVVFLHESMPPWAIGGFSLTMCGVIYYNRMSLHHHGGKEKSIEVMEALEKSKEETEVAPILMGSSLSSSRRKTVGFAKSAGLGLPSRRGRHGTTKLQYSMAASCADALYLPALESHSDSSSSSSDDDELMARTTGRYFL